MFGQSMKYQTCIVFQLSWATMRKGMVWLALAVLTGRLNAEERRFDFSTAPTNAMATHASIPSNRNTVLHWPAPGTTPGASRGASTSASVS